MGFSYLSPAPENDRYFTGHVDDARIYTRALSHSEVMALYNGNQSTGSGVYLLGAPLSVSGSLSIHAGELDVSASNYPITLSGNWLNVGDFTKRSGTVYLRGGKDQTMSGNTVFNNLDITANGRTRSVYFDYRGRQSISGALVLQGTSANPISLRSTKTESGWNILLDSNDGSQTVEYLNVQDSDASGGATLVCHTNTEGCTDSGRNTNWDFSNEAVAAPSKKDGFFFFLE